MRNRYLDFGKKPALESEAENKDEVISGIEEPAEEYQPEEGGIEEVEELESVEVDIVKINEEANAQLTDYFEIQAGEEVLESYAVQLRHLIKTNTGTAQTARILKTAINNQLRSVSLKTESVALEAMTTPASIKQQHEKLLDTIAMEGVISRQISQSAVVSFKHHINAMTDFFKGVNGKVKKYSAKLEAGHKEFVEAKKKFKTDKHVGYLTELWYHFSDDKGAVKNITQALEHDSKLTEYILKEYTAAILEQANVLANLCRNGDLSTPESTTRLVDLIEKMPHPGDMFKPEYVKGQTYLGVTHLDYEKGKGRQPIEINGKVCEKLAYLASPKKIIEAGSMKHAAKKVGAYAAGVAVGPSVGAMGAGAVAQNAIGIAYQTAAGKAAGGFTMTTAEIEKVFVYGKHYIENVKGFLGQEDKLWHVSKDLEAAIAKLGATAKEYPTGKRVLGQIRDFSYALLMYNYNSPARDEVARAIKSAKYCGYLGHRMIYNGKRTKPGTVKEDTPGSQA